MPKMAKNTDVEIGERIVRNLPFLRKLAVMRSGTKRWSYVQRATRDELLAIVEICANILSADFVLNKRQKRKLLPYATYLRQLRRTRTPEGARKVIQKGSGAFLPSLLLPVVFEVARRLISKE